MIKMDVPRSIKHILALAISLLVMIFFYNDMFFHANTKYFTITGDGIQNYYGALYHVKYDTNLFRTESMNYPYGEMMFFTGGHTPITNIIKILGNYFPGTADYTVGIINLTLLCSISLAAFFLYLIFFNLTMPWLVSLISGLGIAFLSPQLDRFGGHLTLSYVMFIPFMLFLLLSFNKKWTVHYSIFILLLFYFAASIHMYFMGFFGIILLFYWGFQILNRKNSGKKLQKVFLHSFLQLILPIILLQLTLILNTDVSDRSEKPWGFLVYRAYPESVFLPFTMPYGHFLHKFMTFKHISWEGISYVGLVSTVLFFIGVYVIAKKIFRNEKMEWLKVTGNQYLDVMFWASFAALLYSFGVPFVLGLKALVDYIGPLKQMRGIARFAWVFFYVMNIVSVYCIWFYSKQKKLPLSRIIIIALPLLMLCYDAYINIRHKPKVYNHSLDILTDTKNKLPENNWVQTIDSKKFQSIIPLPLYHLGSENYWLPAEGDILRNSFIVSLKTGLPISALFLSRSSISQSLNNIQFIKEPYRPLKLLEDMPNYKDFLIVKEAGGLLNKFESAIVKKANLITSNSSLQFYSISFDSLFDLHKNYINNQLSMIEKDSINYHPINDRFKESIFFDFNDWANNVGLNNSPCHVSSYKKWYVFFNDRPPEMNKDSVSYTISFWFSPIDKDLYPRTRLDISVTDTSKKTIYYDNQNIEKYLQLVDNDWGLIETKVAITDSTYKLKVAIRNNIIGKHKKYYIDDFLIKKSDYNIYEKRDTFLWINNRYYCNPIQF